MSPFRLFLVVLALGPYGARSFLALDVYKLTQTVVLDLLHSWEIFAPSTAEQALPLPPLGMKERRLMDRLKDISRRVDGVDRAVREEYAAAVVLLAQDLPASIKYEMRIGSLMESISAIERKDHVFNSYMRTGLGDELNSTAAPGKRRPLRLERHTLETFATSVVSHNPGSVADVMDGLHDIIVRTSSSSKLLNRPGIFVEILNLTESNSNLCHIQQSPQQVLYNLYTALQITQLKAYTMIQFSWMLLRLYGKGNFTLESELLQETYLERMSQQAFAIKDTMTMAKREMWRCDPKRHISGETYTELTKLLQGFIVNEVDLGDKPHCRENCEYHKYTKQNGCYKDNYCSKQPPCRGNIVGCTFVDSDMWICPSGTSSQRRYEWIEYESGRTLGTKKSCSRAITKVDSWWTWLVFHCSYCFCLCDDHLTSSSDRFFNLRPVTSDVNENKVITGLKFVKSARVIHLQIRQGKLEPKGGINDSSVSWKPVGAYDIKGPKVKEGVDYHTLSWTQRAIDLDDLHAPKNYVLTGVRFRRVGSHLNFEIQVSMFNFTTGQLVNGGQRSYWISNDNTDGALDKPRSKLELPYPNVPTRTTSPSLPDSQSDQYLEFGSSDIDRDAAQTTIPFIDIQKVAPEPAVPLTGAGIYHKGKHGYGGFIAPKVFTFDYVPSIRDSFPEIKKAAVKG